MFKHEAWEFVLVNKQYLDCHLVIDSQNYYTSKVFVPVEYHSTICPENIVILLPFHSREEASDIFGGHIFQENKKVGHVTADVLNVVVEEDIHREEMTANEDDPSTENVSTIKSSEIPCKSDNKVYQTIHEQFQCYYCGKTFDKPKSLRQHKYQVHREEIAKYRCSLCPSVFRTPSILQNHIKTHMEPTYQCPKCPRKFKLKHHLVRHSRTCKINSQ